MVESNVEYKKPAMLGLEDGTVFRGFLLGHPGTTSGEVVFNTSMTGYQEILTDPSYRGQVVAMTYPEIGNYGCNEEDIESRRPFVAGFIVRNVSDIASNFRAQVTLNDYLTQNQITGIHSIDTRALVRKIRTAGAMRGVISSEIVDENAIVAAARNAPSMVGRDLVREVINTEAQDWNEALSTWWNSDDTLPSSKNRPLVVALDFGLKWNIARHLVSQGFQVKVVPGTSSAEEILAMKPDGVFLSNGPGDPEPLTYAIETIKNLLGKVPIFGICLGNQLLGLACGAKTYKLKFGHRGANQPVLNLDNHKVEITTQNHGFAVADEGLPDCLTVTHRNLNDNTIAGFKHTQHPAFAVQYHPEASAGPHDSQYLFDQFREMIEACNVTA
ncbi:MAG: glutamine-hydrolyzing carbamoyl-phosphate synthase small subunit [Pirellulaceae bacterium]